MAGEAVCVLSTELRLGDARNTYCMSDSVSRARQRRAGEESDR